MYRLAWYLIILTAQGEWSVEDDDADSSMSAGSKGFSVLMMNKSEDGPDAYAARRTDPPGVAVLDTACQMTMHGAPLRLKYDAALRERRIRTLPRSEETRLRGAGGGVGGPGSGVGWEGHRSSAPVCACVLLPAHASSRSLWDGSAGSARVLGRFRVRPPVSARISCAQCVIM
mgnify:CR=1 FL=1